MSQFDTIYQKIRTGLGSSETKRRVRLVSVLFLVSAIILSVFINFFTPQQTTAAPTYKFKTGKYVGSNGGRKITGLGFQPELVIIKATTNAGVGAFFTSTALPDATSGYLASATANDANGVIMLESDGFSVAGANSNTANVNYTWMAWAGSDCSASGQFCVGTYTGAGSGTKAITTGFQPNAVFVKSNSTVAPTFRTSNMPVNYAQFLTATNQDTTGAYFTTLDATGFTVGASNNTAVAWSYFAFKNTASSISTGTFTGNGTSQDITGLGYSPDAVIVKNANATTAVGAVYNVTQSYGDSSSYFTDTVNVVGAITTTAGADGFSVGASTTANGSTNTIYWVSFGGADPPTSSGTFKMASGTYVGNNTATTGPNYQTIAGLGFAPDLVIIKGNTTQAGAFRTSLMSGDTTSSLDGATGNFALGIQQLTADGFNVGTSATVNSNGIAYYWTAYGNAWRPGVNAGASDFMIGSYYGNGVTGRNITNMPWKPDFVAIKNNTTVAGVFKTSVHSGLSSSLYSAGADANTHILALNDDGFQIGNSTAVNSAAGLYYYFAFKNGDNFQVGSYTGTTAAQNVTSVGFQPDNLWIKAATAVRGVQKTSDMAAANSIPFINVAQVTTNFTGWLSNGFALVGAAADVNVNGTEFKYVAWKKNTGVLITLGQADTQATNMTVPSTNNYIGASFTAITDSSSANITSVKISEEGTVSANANLSNLDIYYETVGTCTYNGTEPLFGTASGFNSADEAIVTGSIYASTSQVCLYAVLDIGSGAQNNETLELEVTNPSTDILTNAGIVSPAIPIVLAGTTTLQAGSNNPPNTPTTLTQKTSPTGTTILESGWTIDNTPDLGFTITDPDSDTVKYQVQVDDASDFATPIVDYVHGTNSTSGTTFAFTIGSYGGGTCTGSCPTTLPDSSVGYWWRVKAIDANTASSSYVEPGVAGTVDIKVDVTTPTGLLVYDGNSVGVDQDNSGTDLTTLAGNWSSADFNVSGPATPNKYQYAIGTTPGGTEIVGWTSTNTDGAVVTVNSLTINTGMIYYWTVRATDLAGNITTVTSNGQVVQPVLSFATSTNTINFADLNNTNSYTDYQPVTLTTQTNAIGGYAVKGYISQLMTSMAYPAQTIANFVGTWAIPQVWNGGTYGFGYTSNDTSVGGSDRFTGGTKYAAYSLTAPGDIVADNSGPTIDGSRNLIDQAFSLTNKVSVPTTQSASRYQTILYLVCTSNF